MVLLSSSFARDVKWSHVMSHPKITPSLPSWPAEGAVSVSMQVQLAKSSTGGTQQCSVSLRKNSFSHGSEGPTWGLSGRPASAPPQSRTQFWFFTQTTQTFATWLPGCQLQEVGQGPLQIQDSFVFGCVSGFRFAADSMGTTGSWSFWIHDTWLVNPSKSRL